MAKILLSNRLTSEEIKILFDEKYKSTLKHVKDSFEKGKPELFHACELLKYKSRYVELAFPDTPHQRYILRHAEKGIKSDSDPVFMSVIFFCPGCGKDFRKYINWQIVGKPRFNKILSDAKAKAEAEENATNN